MPSWPETIDQIAEQNRFAGVVSVDQDGETEFAKAYGLADRAQQIPNTVGTRFGVASGSKGLTALTVISLINDGPLGLSTTARSVLGEDLPLISDEVTVEHLLAHRSGIGDYLDEDAAHGITDYVLTVPAQDLATTDQYLAVLDGYPAKFPPGERFSYCNSGCVVLAVIAERVTTVPFHQLVAERVCDPSEMRDTGFPRSDEPPRTYCPWLPAHRGHLADERLPPAGTWQRRRQDLHHRCRRQPLVAVAVRRKIVPATWVTEMVRPRSDVTAALPCPPPRSAGRRSRQSARSGDLPRA
jgi:CubicO group peptidase (beta-lactamase class C family)